MPKTILKDVFGYDQFRSGQTEVIDTLLAGEHVLAVMPTGSGKSLCFQIPALVKGGLTLVISPLVALMEDQVAALKLAGVAAETINSSRQRESNVDSWRRVTSGEVRLLYLAPERLMTDRMLAALERLPVSLIAIDEAHCLSRWGPSFRPEYEALSILKDRFPTVPIAALTATADHATQEDISAKLFAGKGRTFVSGFDRPNISLNVDIRTDAKQQLLDLLSNHKDESGIVYCLSRKKTDKMAAFLCQHGIRALAYHAGMSAEERASNQETFMNESAVVMVATIAFGMGIDKPDVRFVCHTDMPGNVESYYQEIGRAGRDGKPAVAHMHYGLDDVRMRRLFIEQDGSSDDHKRREHKRLDSLIAYCEAPTCRRQALLDYFNEHIEACGNCDICLNPYDMVEGTEIAQALMAACEDTGQIFGQSHLIDIVRGADTEKIRSLGHNHLPAYGRGAELNKNAWRSIIRQLVASGHLKIDVTGYGGLSMTSKGRAVLDGATDFWYREDLIRQAELPQRKKKVRIETADLNDEDLVLLEALKDLRRAIAKERKVPAYIIFADRSLEAMAQIKPSSESEFATIHGVGAAKLKDFSEQFMALIKDYA